MGLFKIIEKPEDSKIIRQRQRNINKIKRKEEKQEKQLREDYGYLTSERLFEPAMLKEEAIIISFSPFTKELVRISEDGRFGLKYHREEKLCTLFYYKNPIKFDYNLEMESILTMDSEIDIYKMISVLEAEEIALDIVRKERIEKRLQEIKEAGIDALLNKIQKETNRDLEENLEERVLENVQNSSIGEGNVESESDSTEKSSLFNAAFSNSQQQQENNSGMEEKREEKNKIRNVEEKKSETRRDEPIKISWKELFNR